MIDLKSYFFNAVLLLSTPYNTRGYHGSQRGRGDSRDEKKGSVFLRLGGQERKRGGVFGRLSGQGNDEGSQNHDRGNRDGGDWNRGRGSYNRGGNRGGWQNTDKRSSFQRSDSDFMEEDHTQVLLVNIY